MNSNVGQDMSDVNVSRGLSRGNLIPREQLIVTLGVSPKTVTKWEKAGLRAYSPGTKCKFFDTTEVIDFIKTFCEQEE